MKKQYSSPEMNMYWFESENICTVSQDYNDPKYIPEFEEEEDAFDR